jgi:tRNA (guanine37-N1)-methyltransferase
MKAPPIIESVKHWIKKYKLKERKSTKNSKFLIIIPHPSHQVFNQSYAHEWSEYTHLLFICGRYEGIDERVWLWLQKEFPDSIIKISLGKFITLG